MPKKKESLSPTEQSKRFLEEAQRLIDAGELNPTEAEERFELAVRTVLGDRHQGTSDAT
jgi:hypothetical protein